MASDRHLAKLKEGAEAWNSWRRAEPSVRPDLRGLSLTLAEKQWGETNGGPINLAQAMLRDANLRHATLIRSDLSAAMLHNANLSGARLQDADLRNAILANARLDGADLEGAVLDGADLRGADLSSVRNLEPAQIEKARGDAATLLPAKFTAPPSWLNGAKSAAGAPAEKPRWSGTFTKAPEPAPAPPKSEPAPEPVASSPGILAKSSSTVAAAAESARSSWASAFAKPASAVAAMADTARTSWASAFARSTPVAAVGTPAPAEVTLAAPPEPFFPAASQANERPIETANARWSVSLPRAPNVNPVPALRRLSASLRSAVRERVASVNPLRAIGRALGALRSAIRVALAALNPLPLLRAALASLRAFIGARVRAVWAAVRAMSASVRAAASGIGRLRPSWPRLSTAVGVAGVLALVGVIVVFAVAHFVSSRRIDAAVLNENVPLSAQDAAAEEEHPQWAAVGEAKAPIEVENVVEDAKRVAPVIRESGAKAPETVDDTKRVAALTKDVERTSPLTSGEAPVGSIKPSKVSESEAPAAQTKPLQLPLTEAPRAAEPATRLAEAAPAAKVPGAPQKTTDAQPPPKLAQAEGMRPHGEIDAPLGMGDPATPLIAAPDSPAVPLPKQAGPTESAPADDSVTNKMSFAGEGLAGLKIPKPPRTVVDYLREPKGTTKWVEVFIEKYYLSSASLKDADIRQIYSDPLDFFGEKGVGIDRVASEKADYYKHWPKRRYELVAGSIKVEWQTPEIADVTFLYDYKVSAPQKESSKGRGRAHLTLDLTGPTGRIVREDGEVIEGQ